MRGDSTLALLERLDAIVRDAGGAIYPAKDARMAPETFAASFPDYKAFERHIDPAFSSSFWRRVTRASEISKPRPAFGPSALGEGSGEGG